MNFELPLEQLQIYQPARQEPPDFDAFWQETLSQTRLYTDWLLWRSASSAHLW